MGLRVAPDFAASQATPVLSQDTYGKVTTADLAVPRGDGDPQCAGGYPAEGVRMDAPERADVNSDGGDGTADGPGNAHGNASAFRRALDAQAAAEGPGHALVPSGPH